MTQSAVERRNVAETKRRNVAETKRRNVAETTSLVDLLDRVIGAGVVISGDVIISLAGVDLIVLKLRAVLTTAYEDRWTSSTE